MEIPNVNDIASLSPPILLVLFCNIVGWIASTLPFFNNRYIPILLFSVGAVVYPLVGGTIDADTKHKTAHHIVVGAIIGGAAVGTNQAFRQLMNKNEKPNS
jgi:uncharacterized membrane protein YeaQ/YmgE (transglycosylase-associated protein family)